MRCPKCNHEQNNVVECDVCGVIFERYLKIQERRKAAEAEKELQSEKSGNGLKILQVVLLVVVVAAATYYFTGSRRPQVVVQSPKGVANPTNPVPPVNKAPITSVAKVRSIPVQTKIERIPQQHEPPSAASNVNIIERARNATVSIETPWGTGSGFFVNNKYIVTNRHVAQFDEKERDELRSKVEKERRFIELERQKIAESKQQINKYKEGPNRAQFIMFIEEEEAALKKMLPRQQEQEQKLSKMERTVHTSEIKIVLADGKTLTANNLMVSSKHDLALLSLYADDRTYLEKPPTQTRLHEGEKVYAIGSPVGLRHTVTSGIFSGYRMLEKDGEEYLQTDAAINPGNSGGPIIDENGYVRGVTTLKGRDAQGIGFAIPIDIVFDEFNSVLR